MAEVKLGDLANIAERMQSGAPASSGRKSACRNPECQNGLTPGLVAVGKGTKGAPLFGAGGVGAKQLMRWAWVRCLVCNPPDDARRAGAAYKNLHLSAAQIAQRAEMATSKSPYTPVQDQLSKVSRGTLTLLAKAASVDNDQMAEMLRQITQLNQTVMKLTNRVSDLLEENRTLRKQLENRAPSAQ